VSAAAGLKRLGIASVAVVAAGIGALVVAPLFIRADSVREAVTAEIRSVTGLAPIVRGDTAVSLFPKGTVSFTDVVLGEGERPALAAQRLTANLRLLPLLIGRIEIADIALEQPHIAVQVEPDGRSNWSALVAALARTLGGASGERMPSFSEIRVTGGTIVISEAASGVTETLSQIELSLAWPSISKSFGATGRLVWRGQPFDTSINAADLRAAIVGDRSGVKLRLTGAPFKLAFDGHMSHRPTLKMEGTLAADGASLRQALDWAGQKPLPGGGFGRFALKAQTVIGRGNVTLSHVNIELDGNTAEGVLALATEPRITVKGTLAAEALDFTPYISTIELMRGNERDWSRMPIAIDGLSGSDLDLRLSAARITIANAKLGRTGVTANLRDGRLAITIGEAQAFNGVLRGSLALAKSGAGAEIKSQLQFTNVDLESCLGELFGIRRLEGRGDVALNIEGAGDSVLALTRTLSGTASLTAHAGALSGLNLEQLLRRLEQRPLSTSGDFRRGRTPFEKLAIALKITQGTASVEDVQLDGGAVRLALGGSASIPLRDLDLKGTASLVSATANAPVFELPFVVQGPWDDPIMLPDAQALIQRSGAAAPLLDAMRDRKTRDAVRSAIEQLSRDGVILPSTTLPGAPR
jgi:AsmA protein